MWEYLSFYHPDDEQLQEAGKHGWELVAVTSSTAEAWPCAYFKREVTLAEAVKRELTRRQEEAVSKEVRDMGWIENKEASV